MHNYSIMRTSIVALCISVTFTGCATHSLPAPSYDRSDYNSISIITPDNKIDVKIDSRLEGKLKASNMEQAVKGAGEGTLQCMQVPYPPLLVFCGLFVAVGKSISSNIEGVPNEPARQSLAEIVDTVNNTAIQSYLRQQALNYANSQSLKIANHDTGDSAIVRLDIKEIEFKALKPHKDKFPGIILMTFTGSLTKNGVLIDEYEIKRAVSWDNINELNKQQLEIISNKIDAIIKTAAQNYIDEFFLIYHPSPSSPHSQTTENKVFPKTVPDYILRPIYPHASNARKQPYIIDYPVMTKPFITFQWESFPRLWDMLDSDITEISDVSYDFRLYSEGMSMFYERTGLKEPSHSLEISLSPCGKYSWSVRARFKLRGQPRVSEWSGAYNKYSPIAAYSPIEIRRGQTDVHHYWLSIKHFSFGFQAAPTQPGHSCEISQ